MNLNKDVMTTKQLADQLKVVNRNGYLDVLPIDKMEYTWDVIVPKDTKLNPQLIGNWYLYSHYQDGSLYITKDKPVLTEKGRYYLHDPKLSGWLDLDPESLSRGFTCGDWNLIPSDFLRLKLPKVPQGKVIEIEIMPSGNVYFYDYES